MNNEHTLAPDKIEVKREMMSSYQLNIANFYNIPIVNVTKLVPTLFGKEKYQLHYEKFKTILETKIKTKKIYRVLKFNQTQWLISYVEFNKQKKNRSRKKRRQRWKSVVQINEQNNLWQNN